MASVLETYTYNNRPVNPPHGQVIFSSDTNQLLVADTSGSVVQWYVYDNDFTVDEKVVVPTPDPSLGGLTFNVTNGGGAASSPTVQISDQQQRDIDRAIAYVESMVTNNMTIDLVLTTTDDTGTTSWADGGVLAVAGPTMAQNGQLTKSHTNGTADTYHAKVTAGVIKFDPNDLADTDGYINTIRGVAHDGFGCTGLYWVTIHELVHVLGFGVLWNESSIENTGGNTGTYDLVELASEADGGYYYKGYYGDAKYKSLTGFEHARIPIDSRIVNNVRELAGHWNHTVSYTKNSTEIPTNEYNITPAKWDTGNDEHLFKVTKREVMNRALWTGRENQGMLVSEITFACLEDLGYAVNYTVADNIPGSDEWYGGELYPVVSPTAPEDTNAIPEEPEVPIASSPNGGLYFNHNFDSVINLTATSAQKSDILRAIEYVESMVTTSMTINLDVKVMEASDGREVGGNMMLGVPTVYYKNALTKTHFSSIPNLNKDSFTGTNSFITRISNHVRVTDGCLYIDTQDLENDSGYLNRSAGKNHFGENCTGLYFHTIRNLLSVLGIGTFWNKNYDPIFGENYNLVKFHPDANWNQFRFPFHMRESIATGDLWHYTGKYASSKYTNLMGGLADPVTGIIHRLPEGLTAPDALTSKLMQPRVASAFNPLGSQPSFDQNWQYNVGYTRVSDARFGEHSDVNPYISNENKPYFEYIDFSGEPQFPGSYRLVRIPKMEILSPYVTGNEFNLGRRMLVSELTFACLEDLGYSVDYTKADTEVDGFNTPADDPYWWYGGYFNNTMTRFL